MSDWTETKPTKPGWYWYRSDTRVPTVFELLFLFEERADQMINPDVHTSDDVKRIRGLYMRGGTQNLYALFDWNGGEWWSEPIPIPPRQP